MDFRELIESQLRGTATNMQGVLKDISEEEAKSRPQNLTPIIWQAGHIAYYEALLVSEIERKEPEVPANYGELFKQGSGGEADYPAFSEVLDVLERSQANVLRLVEGDLNKPLAGEPLYTTVGGALLFTYYHRGYHFGKIMTLRGLLGKPILF